MPLTTAELQRIKTELGMNALDVGADFYIGIHQILEVVVNQHIDAEVSTTATLGTAIAQASAPTPQTLALADASSFSAGDRVFIDVDTRSENATIQSKSGSSIVVQLKKAHSGTIPVTLEGPIPLALEALRHILEVKGRIAEIFGTGTLKKVDEIEWYPTVGTQLSALGEQLMFWRDELANVLGVPNLWRRKSCGSTVSVY